MSTRDPRTAAGAEPASSPDIDYLAKDYASFRKLMLDRLSLSMPKWRERNPADGMVVVVEALAAAADQLSYFQDAVATEAYLGTARLRTSVRRHSRLLDYGMHEGCAARAWVAFHVEHPLGAPLVFERGTVLQTRAEPERASGSVPAGSAAPGGVETFETLHAIAVLAERNAIEIDAQGARELWLSEGQTVATLIDPSEAGSAELLQAGDVLIFEEIRSPSTGLEIDADPEHRHAVRLIRVTPLGSGSGRRIEVEWHAQDALPLPLCVATTLEGKRQAISVARANVVLVQHGRRWQAEPLDPPEVPEQGPYRPRLRRTGLTHEVPYDHAAARVQPASATLFQDPRAAQPATVLYAARDATGSGDGGDGDRWSARRDLLASDRFARELVVEMGDDGEAWLRFGDGHHGRKPAPGTRFLADYRTGNGSRGNVGRDSIVSLATPDSRVSLRNPLPAQGGIDPEPIEHVRTSAPYAFRKLERGITEADYVELALRHPEVERARAERRWTGSSAAMVLAVVRAGSRPVDAAFQEELGGFLERFRIAGSVLEIRGPRYVAMHIALRVHRRPDRFWSTVEAALLDALGNGQLDDGSLGFFHPSQFGFGEPVYLSRMLERIMRVPGVAWIDSTQETGAVFQQLGTLDTDSLAKGRIPIGPFEIARLDNDPARPEYGRLEFLEAP